MRQHIERHTSTGNQLKWIEDNRYYKQDTFGYEALAEFASCYILSKLNVLDFVDYKIGKGYCYSENFLLDDEHLITVDEILLQSMSTKDFKYFDRESVVNKFKIVYNKVKDFTGIDNFDDYLIKLIHIDYLLLNDDRHFNNIAIIKNTANNTFRLCPVFDNGGSFLSNIAKYPEELSIKENAEKCKAKPFSTSFDKQLLSVHRLNNFKFDYRELMNIYKQFKEYLNQDVYYSEAYHNRVIFTFLQRIKSYDNVINIIQSSPPVFGRR